MERKIITTNDGSHTISIPEMNVTYHSVHGAIRESMHVYIDAGFRSIVPVEEEGAGGRFRPLDIESGSMRPLEAIGDIRLLEMGFGTGLNALLTLIEADQFKQPVHYTAIELLPIHKKEVRELNYCKQLNKSHHQNVFEKLHHCDWNKDIRLTPFFTVHKITGDLITWATSQSFNLIYFDAFAPGAQPELWTKEIFEKLYSILIPDGILVTYCSKGDVRRAMQAAGFSTKKIPGPPGKREMLRAVR